MIKNNKNNKNSIFIIIRKGRQCKAGRELYTVCMLYKIRCNPVHPLNGALPGPYEPARVTYAVFLSHIGTLMHRLAAEPCSAAGLLFPFRCPSGTILPAPVFDGV